MVLHIAGDIATIVISMFTGLVAGGLWCTTSNKNNQRTVCALAMMACVALAAEYLYYIFHAPYVRPGDGKAVQVERGPFTGLNIVILVLGYAVYGAVDYATTTLFIQQAIMVGAAFTAMRFATGDDRYWFFLFACISVCILTFIKFTSTRRNKDAWFFTILFLGSIAATGYGIATLFGPENIGGFAEWVQYTLYVFCDITLVPVLYSIMLFTQGEDESIYAKVKAKAASKVAQNCEKVLAKDRKSTTTTQDD